MSTLGVVTKIAPIAEAGFVHLNGRASPVNPLQPVLRLIVGGPPIAQRQKSG